MGKNGIMTLHFADNYGAVLQAYALQEYMKYIGEDYEIINYVPQRINRQYTINPFFPEGTFKNRMGRMLHFWKRYKQRVLFCSFRKQYLNISEKRYNECDIIDEDYDYIIFGSDQIWNPEHTFYDTKYFGEGVLTNRKKVSYSASFGKKELSPFQNTCINKYLIDFDMISLREAKFAKIVQFEINKQCFVSCDPVFLLGKDAWIGLSELSCFSNRGKARYILLYTLTNDKKIIEYAEQFAEKKREKLLVIHPTCMKIKTSYQQLYNVGPIDFLSLVLQSEGIITNSFHAFCFGIIFGKKVVFRKVNDTDTRTDYIVKIAKVDSCEDKDVVIYDFGTIDENSFNSWINESKNYLTSIKGRSDN